MKHFNKIIATVVVLWLLLAVASTYIIYIYGHKELDKGYLVDLNRINAYLTIGKSISNLDVSQFEYVKEIDYIRLPASKTEIDEFFAGKDLLRSLEYRIEPIFDRNEVSGYIRFMYETNIGLNIKKIIIVLNASLFLMTFLIMIILFYIRKSILKPFNEIVDMPYELSRGHLRTGIKENRNRFFGKFLWGLDLLRENLESHKNRELQLEKEKKMMILSISHDIKTPLSTIKLYSKAIYDNLYKAEEKRIDAAKLIEEKADQIENFVSEIIAASTKDLLDIQVNVGEFYLSELVKRISKAYYEKLKLLKIEFEISEYEDILLKGDLDRITEVFENIIENAIKYGDGKRIRITFEDEDYCKLITVTNSGTPIPSTEFVHMFDSFWRGANAHDKKGNGLGLYICKEIMNKIEGDIFAQSTENTMSVTVVARYS